MKRPRTWKEATETDFDKPEPSMAPMIDVSFLLLIFFIVTMTIAKREHDMTMKVPTPGKGEVPPMSIVVGVEGDGTVVLNPGADELLLSSDSGSRELPLLVQHVEMVRSVSAERNIVVQLRVEEEVMQQRVVDVLNAFATVGVTTVGIVDLIETSET